MLVATLAVLLLVAAAGLTLTAIRANEAASMVVARIDDRPVRAQLAELEQQRGELRRLLDDRSRR